jgi:hypothetical protein
MTVNAGDTVSVPDERLDHLGAGRCPVETCAPTRSEPDAWAALVQIGQPGPSGMPIRYQATNRITHAASTTSA